MLKTMHGNEGVVVRGRAEIDTRQPFSSVREAVMLFGEKVLAGELHGNKFKEMQSKATDENENQESKIGEVNTEVEETKQQVQKSEEEEDNVMAQCLHSMRQQLEEAKRELLHLKTRETLSHHLVVETTSRIDQIMTISAPEEDQAPHLQKKRSVKFASPLMKKMMEDDQEEKTKKKKKKPFVPFLGGLFLKKKKKKRENF